jgi:hypothetical protein
MQGLWWITSTLLRMRSAMPHPQYPVEAAIRLLSERTPSAWRGTASGANSAMGKDITHTSGGNSELAEEESPRPVPVGSPGREKAMRVRGTLQEGHVRRIHSRAKALDSVQSLLGK